MGTYVSSRSAGFRARGIEVSRQNPRLRLGSLVVSCPFAFQFAYIHPFQDIVSVAPPTQDPQDITMPSESQDLNLDLRPQPNPSEQLVKTDNDIPVPPPEISLSPEQSLVLRRVREGRSVFFTGSAGSSLLRASGGSQ